jgi:uncharacterized protein YndB with AHSA1/START domain
VELTTTMTAPCPPERLFAALEDLADYPGWLSIVDRAVPADAAEGDEGPVWTVDLRGRIGPLARSKRLRMVRTVCDAPRRLRFERREVDGRRHSPWVLHAETEPQGDGSEVRLTLHYGGSFGGALLERMLVDEIEASRPRLLERVAPG